LAQYFQLYSALIVFLRQFFRYLLKIKPMRWVVLLGVVILMTSCKALKPAVGRQQAGSTRQADNPQFINGITINTGNKTPEKHKAIDISGENAAVASLKNGPDIERADALRFKYAILMDIPVEQFSETPLFNFIENWYGTRYRFGGTTREGIDCSAFTCSLMAAVFGITLPRMAKEQYKASSRIHKDDLERGDLVFFHTTRKGISHVGVYLGNNKFVHASVNYGVTISDLSEGYYARRFVGAGRMKSPPDASSN
jgi:lipoprotein Spr